MKFNDLVVGLFFCVLGVGLVSYAATLTPPRHLQYGPGFFPGLIGGGLILVGGAMALLGMRTYRAVPLWVRPDWSYSLGGWMRFTSILAAIAFYIVAVKVLGFIITTTIVMTFLLAVRQVPVRRGLPVGLAASVVLTIIFASVLRVPLPWGPLESISGWLLW